MGRRFISILLVFAVAFVLEFLATAAFAADSDVVLSEIMINSMTDCKQNNGEWIEIYNKGSSPVDLTGWRLEDNSGAKHSRTITSSMCPQDSSCVMPAGETWLIAKSQEDLQAEFDHYTNPLSPTVQTTRTIFLNAKIGNGLGNSNDHLILQNSSGVAVDCVSWDGSGTCKSQTYVPGGNGVDQNKDGDDGESIANIATDGHAQWYDHRRNASPYNHINTATNDTTAVVLSGFTARPESASWWLLSVLSFGVVTGLILIRKEMF